MSYSLNIYGVSDDLVEIEFTGSLYHDDDEVGTSNVLIQIGNHEEGGALIRMNYTKNGTWAASISRIDEDIDWPFSILISPGGRDGKPSAEGYSVLVSVDNIPQSMKVTYKDLDMR